MASDQVGIVVGLSAEARIARRSGSPVAVGGGTSAGAEQAARSLADRGVRALLSFGLAGGLDPALAPGALLVPRALLVDGERIPNDPALLARFGGATCEALLCGASIAATVAAKARLFGETGAAAIDLESGAVARVARERGIAVGAVRAVCDPAGRSLPRAALVALSGSGRIRIARILGSLLRHPGQLPALIALGRDAAAARKALLGAVLAVAVVVAALLPAAARAQGGPRQSALCATAISRAEEVYQTPPGLLVTIGKVESGRRSTEGGVEPWPWTINADGQGYFFASKAEAVDWARRGLASGVQFMDVGCMQVDLRMHPGAFRSLEDAFDPGINAEYAARFLRTLRDGAGGNWYTAIGLYHSHTPDLAAYYRLAVAAVGAGLPVPGMGPRVGRPVLTRVALTGGGATMLNLRRQPARVRRTMDPCRIAAMLGSYLRSAPAGCHRS